MAGLARCERTPGPCRPSKLRLVLVITRRAAPKESMPAKKHSEQPLSRHSKPASRKTRSSPSASASRFTVEDPGTTIAFTPGATLRPREDARGLAQVRQPAVGARADEGRLDRRAGDRCRRGEAPCTRARAPARPARRPEARDGSGTRPSMAIACSGLVPQVTCGASAGTSSSSARVPATRRRRRRGRASAPPRARRSSPFGANGLRATQAMAASSGATRPVHAPNSTAMLHSVRRPSTDSARTASPANSMAWPVAAGRAEAPDEGERHVLAPAPAGSRPRSSTRMAFGRRRTSVCVATACSPSVEPIPHASAPIPPTVPVWLSGQTMVKPGSAMPCSGETTWTMPCRGSSRSTRRMPAALVRSRKPATKALAPGPRERSRRPGSVSTAWSMIPRTSPGWAGAGRPPRGPPGAPAPCARAGRCGRGAAATRPPPSSATTCSSQIFAMTVRGAAFDIRMAASGFFPLSHVPHRDRLAGPPGLSARRRGQPRRVARPSRGCRRTGGTTTRSSSPAATCRRAAPGWASRAARRFAAVTNFRDPSDRRSTALSRGDAGGGVPPGQRDAGSVPARPRRPRGAVQRLQPPRRRRRARSSTSAAARARSARSSPACMPCRTTSSTSRGPRSERARAALAAALGGRRRAPLRDALGHDPGPGRRSFPTPAWASSASACSRRSSSPAPTTARAPPPCCAPAAGGARFEERTRDATGTVTDTRRLRLPLRRLTPPGGGLPRRSRIVDLRQRCKPYAC